MDLSLMVAAGIALVGAVLALIYLPARQPAAPAGETVAGVLAESPV
jgi:hypothetical protein